MNLTTTELLDQIEILNHIQPVTIRYQLICELLKLSDREDLYLELVAPGYSTYSEAKQWFTSYYIEDDNEGDAVKNRIRTEIANADPKRLYMTQPDFNYGYDYTPDHFKPVNDNELTKSIQELIKKIQNPTTRMYF